MKFHMGQSESGIADFNEAIRLKSDDAEVYTNRGMVKFSLRQYESALADYNEATNPNYATAYSNRSTVKLVFGNMSLRYLTVIRRFV